MNLDEIIKSIKHIAGELYPGEPEVSKLCQELIQYERENISKATHRYKEHYRRHLEDFLKRKVQD